MTVAATDITSAQAAIAAAKKTALGLSMGYKAGLDAAEAKRMAAKAACPGCNGSHQAAVDKSNGDIVAAVLAAVAGSGSAANVTAAKTALATAQATLATWKSSFVADPGTIPGSAMVCPMCLAIDQQRDKDCAALAQAIIDANGVTATAQASLDSLIAQAESQLGVS